LATDAFVRLAELQSKAMGFPDLDLVVIEHPLGGIDPAEVRDKAAEAATTVARRLRTAL